MCSNDDIILYQYFEFSNEVVVNMMKIPKFSNKIDLDF